MTLTIERPATVPVETAPEQPTESPAKKILKSARALIENGWIQGDFSQVMPDDKIAYCSVGALSHAAYDDTSIESGYAYRRAIENLASVIRPEYQEALDDAEEVVINFNDRETRTKEEVLATFDKAIEKA